MDRKLLIDCKDPKPITLWGGLTRCSGKLCTNDNYHYVKLVVIILRWPLGSQLSSHLIDLGALGIKSTMNMSYNLIST